MSGLPVPQKLCKAGLGPKTVKRKARLTWLNRIFKVILVRGYYLKGPMFINCVNRPPLLRQKLRNIAFQLETKSESSSIATFSFPEPTICSASGGIVGLWYQPLPDVVKFTTSGSACLIR